MATTSNDFFGTVAKDINSKIIHANPNYKDYLQNPKSQLIFFMPTNKKEVCQLMIR